VDCDKPLAAPGDDRYVRRVSDTQLLRQRLRAALPVAMKSRDRTAVSVLRATLSAIDNAEAAASPDAAAGTGAIERSPLGAGATEVARVELSAAQVEALVRGELAERLEAAAGYERAGQDEAAERLRAEAAVLQTIL
jgi:uncharacterized protein